MIISLFTFLMCLFLFFGLYVLLINPEKKVNIVFFCISLLLSLQCITSAFLQFEFTVANEKALSFWAKVGSISFLLTIYLLLIFYNLHTRIFKVKWYSGLILLLLPLYISIKLLFISRPATFIYKDEILYFSDYNKLFNEINIYLNLYFVAMIILLIIWLFKFAERRNKKQIYIILIAQILSIALAELDQYVLFFLTKIYEYRIPGSYIVYFTIWIAGIWYVMVRYRFMAFTPALITQDILSNIDENVILLDTEMKIISFNEKHEGYAHLRSKYLNSHISTLIDNYDSLSGELEELKQGKHNDFGCRLNFKIGVEELYCMDVKFKSIRDKFHDLIGILLVAKEVKELKQLKSIYRITGREANVIQDVLSGRTNHEIADDLNITERTVKAHLTNIFNKLGVDNKMQLVMLLKEFNLIPEKPAGKILFSKQKQAVSDLKLF
jgi:DNA-binding CsgD family transcriptional regulator